jgi:hypothetical protein
VPREVHETYATNPDDPDGEGIRTGYVVVARESEWDDTTRARALALVEYEEGLCSCGCGLPREQAYLKQPFMVHKVTCYADKAIQSRSAAPTVNSTRRTSRGGTTASTTSRSQRNPLTFPSRGGGSRAH